MNSTSTLRPLPMRRVVLSLTDEQLDALDSFSAVTGEPRTVLIRQAIDLFLLMHDGPAETLSELCDIVIHALGSQEKKNAGSKSTTNSKVY